MNGWHPGELDIRQKLAYDLDPTTHHYYTYIRGDLDPDHARFHTGRLPFLPVTTLDGGGRPWGSILAAEDGKPGDYGQGYIAHPRYTVLTINTKVWVGDPLIENKKAFSFDPSTGTAKENGEDMLIAGIGIEFTTRRRNKFAGKVTKFNVTDDNVDMEIHVNESIGNCPKYINVRSLDPHPNTSPRIKHRVLNLPPKERLPEDVISFIQDADTVFLGTTYTARDADKMMYPSHVGMNQRGGRPGFVRVKPSDGRTVVVPDFSGM
ncbi:hypothetical protein E1B28_011145 [Marasmius oreades]|uniref:Uncharacterized protein n=1 Tax=Marasmius oreades TaxID=181124 RepID=A0A9P7RTL4_9AGAR|nr:uncharacterized protein E1B28_011145 [Marasmius oreades]KAG7089460.1 hypothetical protein E1B28_011145 [Marasmius oreades]